MTTSIAARSVVRPRAVGAALVLTTALAAVTSGGAIYFSLFWADAPSPSVWTVLFAVGFVGISLAGIAAAAALVRGSERGRRGVVAYAAFGILFTLAKLIWWQETEALVFGVLDIALLLLVSSPSVRAWTSEPTT